MCCLWYPGTQPNLSTPAKKTKKAEIDLPPNVLLLPLNRFPNRKTNKCRNNRKIRNPWFLVVRFDGVLGYRCESDGRDDAFSSCLFDVSRAVSTMRNKTILVSIPQNKPSCLTGSRCKYTNPSFENQRRTQTRKTVLLRKQREKQKRKTPRGTVNQPGRIPKGYESLKNKE